MPDPTIRGALNLEFSEQIAFFRGKMNVGTVRWDQLRHEAHDYAFTVAGAMKADLLADLRDAVDKGVSRGGTLRDFRRDFRQIVANRGWTGWTGQGTKKGEAWRTRIIFETNILTSQAAGRYAQLTDPAFLSAYPYWQYVHNDSVRYPRELHKQWGDQRLTLRHDHPFWQTHYPPNGWLCRCRVKAVMRPKDGDATEPPIGWDAPLPKTGAPPGIDKGWAYAPGASIAQNVQTLVQNKVQTLPPPLAQALQAVTSPWNSTTQAGVWHQAAFQDAPEHIRRAIKDAGDPKRILKTPNATPYHRPGKHIEMDGLSEQSLLGQSTWRHEYGHFVDNAIGKKKGLSCASADPAFATAMMQDKDALIAAGAHGPAGKITAARRTALKVAYKASQDEFLLASNPEVWLEERYKKAGIAYELAKEAIEKHAAFPTLYTGVGKADRYRRIIVAIENGDAQGLMDALTGGRNNGSEWIDAFDKGVLGNLSDLFGSVTRNEVSGRMKSGFGHKNSYYKNDTLAAGKETFANLFDIHGENGLFWRYVLERMLPETNRTFWKLLK